MKRNLLLGAVFLACFACIGASSTGTKNTHEYDEIHAYYVDWNLVTRVRMSANDVRRIKHSYLETNRKDIVLSIKNALDSLQCDKIANADADVRIVLDFYIEGKLIKSIYGSHERLIDSSAKKSCRMSKDFLSALNLTGVPLDRRPK